MKETNTPKAKTQPQRQRFIETAKKVEAEESGEDFKRVFEKIMPPKLRSKPSNDK